MVNIVYSGRSNEISLVLEARASGDDWAPANMASVTDVSVDFGTTVISSTESPDAISWALTSVPSYDDPVYVVTLMLGDSGLAVGRYDAHLIVTDPDYPDGLVWSLLAVKVVDLN